jgi:8-oxo-dGTP pyrophosphatase MutT (NUDIX family)
MSKPHLAKWQINSSKYIVNDRWLKLRADSCTTPDGRVIDPYYVFEYPEWVNCFVVDDNNDVLMLRHYRHGAGEYLLELVAGAAEVSDTSLKESIRRELLEELGYTGGEVHHLGATYPNAATHTNKVHSFIAIGGSCTQPQQLEKGETLHVTKVALQDIIDQFDNGILNETYQSTMLLTMFLAVNFLRRTDRLP